MKQDKERHEEREEAVDQKRERGSRMPWRLLGFVGLALAATTVLANLSDIKRYIRISTM